MSENVSKNTEKSEVLKDISDDQLLEEVFRRNWLKERFFQKMALEKMMENWLIKNTTSVIKDVLDEKDPKQKLLKEIQWFLDDNPELDVKNGDDKVIIKWNQITFQEYERWYPWKFVDKFKISIDNGEIRMSDINWITKDPKRISKNWRIVTKLIKNSL